MTVAGRIWGASIEAKIGPRIAITYHSADQIDKDHEAHGEAAESA